MKVGLGEEEEEGSSVRHGDQSVSGMGITTEVTSDSLKSDTMSLPLTDYLYDFGSGDYEEKELQMSQGSPATGNAMGSQMGQLVQAMQATRLLAGT